MVRVEDSPMAWAFDEFVGWVEIHLAARMSADVAVRDKLPVIQMNQKHRTPCRVVE